MPCLRAGEPLSRLLPQMLLCSSPDGSCPPPPPTHPHSLRGGSGPCNPRFQPRRPLPLPHFPGLESPPQLRANLYHGLTCPAEGRSAGSSAQFALRAPPKSFRRARWRRANVPAAGSGGGRSVALAGRSNRVADFAGRDVLLPSSSSQRGGKSGGHSLLESWRPGSRPSGI